MTACAHARARRRALLQAVEELVAQARAQGEAVTDIVMACGSGGTTAGLALGSHLRLGVACAFDVVIP